MNQVVVVLTVIGGSTVRFSVSDPNGDMTNIIKKGVVHIHIESEIEKPRTETLFNRYL